ncbi:MAG: hypothetical protein ACLTV1_06495 [Christensenellales bacterium]
MQQKFHKRLSGGFQKLLTDIDLAAVRHTEGGILKIGSILHIDDRTAATNKKARVLFLSGSVNALKLWRMASVLPAVVRILMMWAKCSADMISR